VKETVYYMDQDLSHVESLAAATKMRKLLQMGWSEIPAKGWSILPKNSG
jgi:hypothetical protein